MQRIIFPSLDVTYDTFPSAFAGGCKHCHIFIW